MPTIKLTPSILSADFARLEAHAREAIEAGADWLHVDVLLKSASSGRCLMRLERKHGWKWMAASTRILLAYH